MEAKLSHVSTYEKISELIGDGFKIHERAISDISFRGSAEAFKKFLENVKNLSESEKPKLLGLFADRKQGTQNLAVILGFGKEFPTAILFVEVPGNETLPSLYEVWNYARWWELESETFHGVRFETLIGTMGAAWQPS